MKKIVFCVLLVMVAIQGFAQKAYFPLMIHDMREYEIQSVHCLKTGTAPVIDGDLNDAVWENARTVTGFRSCKTEERTLAENQTHVSLLYDHQFLYVSFVCKDSDMGNIQVNNYRYDDENIKHDDRVEIYLDPLHDHKNMVYFAINPDGYTLDKKLKRPIQYSYSYVEGNVNDFNTKWHVRTRKYDDRWTVEAAIAWDRLLEQKVEPGMTWGVNFARVYHPRVENRNCVRDISSWTEGLKHPFGCEHDNDYLVKGIDPINFGDMIFGNKVVKVKSIQFHEGTASYSGKGWRKPQLWGNNPLRLTLENRVDQTKNLLVTVTTQGFQNKGLKDVRKISIPAHAEKILDLVIPIRENDMQPFTIAITDAETSSQLYQTTYSTRVPQFIEFNLEAVYVPNGIETTGHIQYTPVCMPGALKNHTIKMSLRLRGDKNPIAVEKFKSPAHDADFEDCFKNVNLSDLSDGNYSIDVEAKNDKGELVGQFAQNFTRNTHDGERDFCLLDTTYSYGGNTGDAIIVQFPDQKDFVFWEQASNIPWWEMSNQAITYEFVECWGFGYQACNEPMQDKENRYSRVTVLENTPARVKIKWTYALSNPNYKIFFNEWVDEYYILYPDGIGTRSVHLWPNTNLRHEVLQPQYIISPGLLPHQLFEEKALEVFDLSGHMQTDWIHKPLEEEVPVISTMDWEETIFRMNFKNRDDAYLVYSPREDIMPNLNNAGLLRELDNRGDLRYNLGAHWPAKKLNVDVYSLVGTEGVYHTWSGATQIDSDSSQLPNIYRHLFGVTDKDNEYIKDVATSWLFPANIEIEKGNIVYDRYDVAQRAFIFSKDTDGSVDDVQFTVNLSKEVNKRPRLVNPVFIIEGTSGSNIELYKNGKLLQSTSFRFSSIEREYRGADLVVWIDDILKDKDSIAIEIVQ